MTRAALLETLEKIINENGRQDAEPWKLDEIAREAGCSVLLLDSDHFEKVCGMDSLDWAEVVLEIEEEFDISVSYENSIGDILAMIDHE